MSEKRSFASPLVRRVNYKPRIGSSVSVEVRWASGVIYTAWHPDGTVVFDSQSGAITLVPHRVLLGKPSKKAKPAKSTD